MTDPTPDQLQALLMAIAAFVRAGDKGAKDASVESMNTYRVCRKNPRPRFAV